MWPSISSWMSTQSGGMKRFPYSIMETLSSLELALVVRNYCWPLIFM